MKHESVSFRCDVTGEEIDDVFGMLELTVHRSVSSFETPGTQVHLSADVHRLAYPRVVDNQFAAYLDPAETVVMVAESGPTGTRYFGKDAEDPTVARLFDAIERALSPSG